MLCGATSEALAGLSVRKDGRSCVLALCALPLGESGTLLQTSEDSLGLINPGDGFTMHMHQV